MSSTVSFNITCDGSAGYSEYHDCPVGPGINYTCTEGLPYVASVSCSGAIDHQVSMMLNLSPLFSPVISKYSACSGIPLIKSIVTLAVLMLMWFKQEMMKAILYAIVLI